jgi:hypothetical protein
LRPLAVPLFLFLTVPAAAQMSPQLLGSLRDQVKAEGSRSWSPRQLGWPDFHGSPRLGTSTAAQTSSGVTYLVECRDRRFRYAVLATFSPTESWVRPDIPPHRKASRSTLKHEQIHFDITEIFARRLRQAFAGASRLCPGRLNDARKIFDRLSRDSQKMQERYDKETGHGLVQEAQLRWSRAVGSSLDSLAGYRQE